MLAAMVALVQGRPGPRGTMLLLLAASPSARAQIPMGGAPSPNSLLNDLRSIQFPPGGAAGAPMGQPGMPFGGAGGMPGGLPQGMGGMQQGAPQGTGMAGIPPG